MKKTLLYIFLLCELIFAQEFEPRIGIDLGFSLTFFNNTTVKNEVINNFTVKNETNAPGGYIKLNYYATEKWTGIFSIGVLTAKSSNSVTFQKVSNESSAIIPIEMGLNYNFLVLDGSPNMLKPYITGTAGILLGATSKNEMMQNQNSVHTAVSFVFGGGINLFLNSWLKFNFEARYRLASEFAEEVSGRSNYTGPEINIGAGFLF